MGADPKPTVGEVMRHVADLEAATTPEAKNIARSLIALKVAALSGESMQAAFEALRPLPEKAQTMGNIGGRALKPVPSAPMKDEPLEKVVDGLVRKLELVPARPRVIESLEQWDEMERAPKCRDCGGPCSSAEGLCEGCGRGGPTSAELEDVPWGVTS